MAWIAPDARANSLGAKLVQLTMPGVPDVYQGCELTALSLVDPDNRRPVDFRAAGGCWPPCGPARRSVGLDAEKLLVTTRALRLRREHPDWFAGGYTPLAAKARPPSTRSRSCAATRRSPWSPGCPSGLRRRGGWEDTALPLPARTGGTC